MNFIQFIGTEDFGISALVLAVAVGITDFALKKIKGVPDYIANYLPLIVALLGTGVAEIIADGHITFSETAFYTAITSYSVGTLISVFARKTLRGENTGDALFALVQCVSAGVLKDGAEATLHEIVAILSDLIEQNDKNDELIKDKVVSVLEAVKKDGVSPREITDVAEIILLSAKRLKKEK